MRVFLKILKGILIGVWAIIAIFTTICLLSYNQFNVPVLGRTTLLIIDNDYLEPDYTRGDLVVITRASNNDIEVGSNVLFYNEDIVNSTVVINIAEVIEKEEVTDTETMFELAGRLVSGQYVIGQVEDARIFGGLGVVFGILTSQWGFLLFVIFPTLFAVVYEVFKIVEEARKARKEA